jgi:hypothetical protein
MQKIIRAAVAFVVAASLMTTAPIGSVALAQSQQAEPHCTQVSGAFSTNFIAPDQTAGTATGDLRGALGVKVLGVVSGSVGNGKPVALHVQHFWVTETGDTLFTKDAVVTAYPSTSPGQPLLYSFAYEQGIELIGGTGKFGSATGLLKAWGGIDLGAGEVAGRYRGEICFKAPSKP